MPFAKYKTTVNAPYEKVLALLTDKMEHPKKYVGMILYSNVLERADGYIVREMYEPKPADLVIKEKIYHRPVQNGEEFVYEHMNNARYTGVFRNVLTRIPGKSDAVELEYVMDWTPHAGTEEQLPAEKAQGMVQHAVHHMKTLAENPVDVPSWVRAFYNAVDTKTFQAMRDMVSENFTFRMGNAPEILGRDRFIAVSEEMCKGMKGMLHDYVSVHQVGDDTLVEAWVEYTMLDDKVYLLPFMTLFVRKEGKITGVKVFGDPSPLHHGWGH